MRKQRAAQFNLAAKKTKKNGKEIRAREISLHAPAVSRSLSTPPALDYDGPRRQNARTAPHNKGRLTTRTLARGRRSSKLYAALAGGRQIALYSTPFSARQQKRQQRENKNK